MPGPESIVMDRWNHAKKSRLGRWLFSHAVGRFAPYSGTIGARIEALEVGRATIHMRDRRAVRNHLRSIHAAALANLIELSGSLAIIASLQPNTRMIPVRLEIEYVKKARGLLTAQARCQPPDPGFEGELQGEVAIRDASGDQVARGKVTVVIGARESVKGQESSVKLPT